MCLRKTNSVYSNACLHVTLTSQDGSWLQRVGERLNNYTGQEVLENNLSFYPGSSLAFAHIPNGHFSPWVCLTS